MTRPYVLIAVVLLAAGVSAVLLRDLFPLPPAPQADAASVVLDRGLEAMLAGDFEGARIHLARVPHGSRAFAVALDNLTTIDRELEGLGSARTRLSDLLGHHPEDADLRLRLARLAYDEGDFAAANGEAARAAAAAPADPRPRYALALYQLAAGALPEAIESYHAAIAADSDPRYPMEAFDALWRHASRFPDQVETHFALAYFCSLAGYSTQERIELARFLAATPSGPIADAAARRLAALDGPEEGHGE